MAVRGPARPDQDVHTIGPRQRLQQPEQLFGLLQQAHNAPRLLGLLEFR